MRSDFAVESLVAQAPAIALRVRSAEKTAFALGDWAAGHVAR